MVTDAADSDTLAGSGDGDGAGDGTPASSGSSKFSFYYTRYTRRKWGALSVSDPIKYICGTSIFDQPSIRVDLFALWQA